MGEWSEKTCITKDFRGPYGFSCQNEEQNFLLPPSAMGMPQILGYNPWKCKAPRALYNPHRIIESNRIACVGRDLNDHPAAMVWLPPTSFQPGHRHPQLLWAACTDANVHGNSQHPQMAEATFRYQLPQQERSEGVQSTMHRSFWNCPRCSSQPCSAPWTGSISSGLVFQLQSHARSSWDEEM